MGKLDEMWDSTGAVAVAPAPSKLDAMWDATPAPVTALVASAPDAPRGMIEPPTLDLSNRPRVRNADGSISTIRSIGVDVDGKQVLIPTVSDDGRIMSNKEAVQAYRTTGKHLGTYATQADVDAAGQFWHDKEQAKLNATPRDQFGQTMEDRPAQPSMAAPEAAPLTTSPGIAAEDSTGADVREVKDLVQQIVLPAQEAVTKHSLGGTEGVEQSMTAAIKPDAEKDANAQIAVREMLNTHKRVRPGWVEGLGRVVDVIPGGQIGQDLTARAKGEQTYAQQIAEAAQIGHGEPIDAEAVGRMLAVASKLPQVEQVNAFATIRALPAYRQATQDYIAGKYPVYSWTRDFAKQPEAQTVEEKGADIGAGLLAFMGAQRTFGSMLGEGGGLVKNMTSMELASQYTSSGQAKLGEGAALGAAYEIPTAIASKMPGPAWMKAGAAVILGYIVGSGTAKIGGADDVTTTIMGLMGAGMSPLAIRKSIKKTHPEVPDAVIDAAINQPKEVFDAAKAKIEASQTAQPAPNTSGSTIESTPAAGQPAPDSVTQHAQQPGNGLVTPEAAAPVETPRVVALKEALSTATTSDNASAIAEAIAKEKAVEPAPVSPLGETAAKSETPVEPTSKESLQVQEPALDKPAAPPWSAQRESATISPVTPTEGAGRTTPPEETPQAAGGKGTAHLDRVRARGFWTVRDVLDELKAQGVTLGKGEYLRFDPEDLSVGQDLKTSRVWDDGKPTDRTKKGTSALDPSAYQYEYHKDTHYAGKVYIVKGTSARKGFDPAEVVVQNAKVVRRINLPDSFSPSARPESPGESAPVTKTAGTPEQVQEEVSTGAKKEYRYRLTLRPASTANTPGGAVRFEDDGSQFGVAVYDKPLAQSAQKQFAMEPLDPLDPANVKKGFDNAIAAIDKEADYGEQSWQQKEGLYSPDTRRGGEAWRLTYFDAAGKPTGHTEFSSYQEARDYAASQRNAAAPVPERQQLRASAEVAEKGKTPWAKKARTKRGPKKEMPPTLEEERQNAIRAHREKPHFDEIGKANKELAEIDKLAEVEQQKLPEGYTVKPMASEEGYYYVEDAEGNGVGRYPLTMREAIDEAWKESGQKPSELPKELQDRRAAAQARLDAASAALSKLKSSEEAPAAPVIDKPSTTAQPEQGKQGWEMGLLEYGKSRLPKSQADQITNPRQVASFSGQHIKGIKAAIERNLPVPAAVLSEYKGTPWADEALAKMEKAQTTGKGEVGLDALGKGMAERGQEVRALLDRADALNIDRKGMTEPELVKAIADAEAKPKRIVSDAGGKKAKRATPGGEAGAMASPVRELAAPIKRDNAPPRIEVAPIEGGTPKALDKIIMDVGTLRRSPIFGGKTPRSAAGVYRPGTAETMIRFQGDLDTAAHEVAHSFDDLYRIVPGAKYRMNKGQQFGETPWSANRAKGEFDEELSKFWWHGSASESGPHAKLTYKRGEGVAEFLRAYMVNPEAAKAEAPRFYEFLKKQMPADAWAKLDAFGKDIREWAGLDPLAQIGTNIEVGEKSKLQRLRESVQRDTYDYRTSLTTIADKLFRDDMAPIVAGYEQSLRLAAKDLSAMKPSDNALYTLRRLTHTGGTVDEQLVTGLVDWGKTQKEGKWVLAEDNGKPMTQEWLLEPLDKSGGVASMNKDMELVRSFMVAERVVERAEVLDKQSYREIVGGIDKQAAKIEKVLDGPLAETMDEARVAALSDEAQALRQAVRGADALTGPAANKLRAIADALPETQWAKQAIKAVEWNARRKQRLSGTGGGIVSDLKQSEAAVEQMKQDPETYARIGEAARRYRAMADVAILKAQVDLGRITQKSADAIREDNQFYTDMHRVMEDRLQIRPLAGGKRPGKTAETIHAFEGSTRRIMDTYLNLLEAVEAAQAEGIRNQFKQQLTEPLIGKRGMYEGAPQQLSTIGRKVAGGTPDAITLYRNGKKEHWLFEPEIQKVLKGVDQAAMDGLLSKVLQIPGRIMQAAVVWSPPFMVRNKLRDIQSWLVLSETGATPWDALRRQRPEDAQGLRLGGGDFSGYYQNRRTYQKALKETARELADDKGTILTMPGDLARAYGRMGKWSERSTRTQEYRNAFKKAVEELGYNEYDASLYAAAKARDLMDFAMAGSVVRQINKYIKFTAPAMRGVFRAIEGVKRDPVGVLTKWALYVVVPTLAVRAWNAASGNEEEYDALPAWRRDLYYNFKVASNTWISIPKPFELGALGSAVERAIQTLRGKKDAWDGYAGSMSRALLPVDESALFGPGRAVVGPIANYDFLRNGPIVPDYEKDLPVEYRKGAEHATNAAKLISKATASTIDPRYIDNFINGQFGSLGRMATTASNIGRTDVGGIAGGAEKTAEYIAGVFGTSPAYNSVEVQRAMELLRQNQRTSSREAKALRAFGEQYRQAKTDAEKDQIAKQMREYARSIVPYLEKLTPGIKTSPWSSPKDFTKSFKTDLTKGKK